MVLTLVTVLTILLIIGGAIHFIPLLPLTATVFGVAWLGFALWRGKANARIPNPSHGPRQGLVREGAPALRQGRFTATRLPQSTHHSTSWRLMFDNRRYFASLRGNGAITTGLARSSSRRSPEVRLHQMVVVRSG